MGTIKKPEQFNIASVEVKKDKVVISWVDEGNQHTRTSKTPMHPDFVALLERLKNSLADYYDLESTDDIDFKKVSVNNYEDDEGQSVMIKGVFIHPKSTQRTTISTSKVQTHEDAYGFETELKNCITELATEACEYVFEGKSNQTTMEFEEAA